MKTPNGWEQYKVYVMEELKRQASQNGQILNELKKIRERIFKLEEKIAILKVKYGLLGGLMGAIASLIIPIINWLKK